MRDRCPKIPSDLTDSVESRLRNLPHRLRAKGFTRHACFPPQASPGLAYASSFKIQGFTGTSASKPTWQRRQAQGKSRGPGAIAHRREQT